MPNLSGHSSQPRWCDLFLLACGFVVLCHSTYHIFYRICEEDEARDFEHASIVLEKSDLTAGNSTLGFESIFAISSESFDKPLAWRRKGLLEAAYRTGLEIQIPAQLPPSEGRLLFLQEGGENHRRPTEGATHAWIAHLDMLAMIVDHNLTSALILEDDVDWDLSIRSQLPPLAQALRKLTSANNKDNSPYGNDWDLLWLGHCGEVPAANTPGALIHDESVLPMESLQSIWGPERYFLLPKKTRSLQRSSTPMCTFAYAVSAKGARKTLDFMSNNRGEAYDVNLAGACRDGKLDCWSISPELLRHHHVVGTMGLSASHDLEEDTGRRFTFNIRHSARCNVKREVDDLTQCLPTKDDFQRYRT